LLSELLPIDKSDLELLWWAYTLPRDAEGWVLVDGERTSKPKQSLVTLLREFSSELDKWRSVRSNADSEERTKYRGDHGWTVQRREAAFAEFPDAILPPKFGDLPVEYQRRIDERVKVLPAE
jgi:hypothetical protein